VTSDISTAAAGHSPKIGFVIVGTQKGGTTAINRYLRQHREIGMAVRKELHFFNNEALFKERPVDYGKLEAEFDLSQPKKIRGEVTPIYMYWEPCMQRIREYNPEMKIIVSLRNPASRAFSHWNMEFDRGTEQHDFLYAVQHEEERIQPPLSRAQRLFSYVSRGFYAPQIRRILEHFPREQVFFVKYESFLADQERSLREIFEFLGVNAQKYRFKAKRAHERNYVRRISPEEKAYLAGLFHDDICEVEKLLGWDCSDWKAA